jgi:hypothetical protein
MERKRPFRVRIDPLRDGAEIVNDVGYCMRSELLRCIRLDSLLEPSGGANVQKQ